MTKAQLVNYELGLVDMKTGHFNPAVIPRCRNGAIKAALMDSADRPLLPVYTPLEARVEYGETRVSTFSADRNRSCRRLCRGLKSAPVTYRRFGRIPR